MKRQGKKLIVDASEPYTIKVTARDVKGASRKSPTSCAIAKGALHGGCLSSRIGQRVALIEFRDVIRRYSITSQDQKKIIAFDNAGYFQPGEYTLIPPPDAVKKSRASMRKYWHKVAKKKSGPSGKHVIKKTPIRHMMREKLEA